MKQGVDYIGVTVCFYCHDGKGKLLLNKRSENCRDEKGRWDCGGGALKFAETWEEGVRREVEEEYTCQIKKLDIVAVNNVIRTHEGRQTHWIAIIYAAEVNPRDVTIGDKDKISEIGWFNLNKLPKPLHSMYLTHLQYVKDAGII